MSNLNLSTNIPLSLYIHIPWCVKKCPYCDFNSHNLKGEIPEDKYIDCLLDDLKNDLQILEQEDNQNTTRNINTIFIGGGTPSLLSAKALDKLLRGIEKLVSITKETEITMEANPGTFEQEKFKDYYLAGINRLSLGIQSFEEEKLNKLGRIHGSNEALRAIDIARKAGFTNFNLDLMFALPNQTTNQALKDLSTAIEQEPTHISWYQLTLEPNTYFYHKPPKGIPNHDKAWDITAQGQALLKDSGYMQYEVSAYAKNKNYCKHNKNYWEFGDYIGIGAGAHGKISIPGKHKVIRTVKFRNPKDYINAKPKFTSSINNISKNDISFEFMLNALRLTDGFNIQTFEERVGLPFASQLDIIKPAQDKGLITFDGARMRTTELGRKFMDDIIVKFLREQDDPSTI